MQSLPLERADASQRADDVRYGPLRADEVAAAAAIYLESFPQRVARWFHNERHAATAFADLFELVRVVHGQTFFAARLDGQLAGYLALTLPERRLVTGLVHPAAAFRVAAHLVTGQYGFPRRALERLVAARASSPAEPVEIDLSGWPHVYVIAVRPGLTGFGIGTRLLERAHAACAGKYDRIGLYVERQNDAAIRFYQRHGYRVIHSAEDQHGMVRNLA